MKRVIILCLILFYCASCTGCTNTKANWRYPDQISLLGISKNDTLKKLKLNDNDLTDTNTSVSGIWKIKDTVSIYGLIFDTYLGFDTSNNSEPFTKIIYEYIGGNSFDEKDFSAIKKIAKHLTKKYKYPYTKAIYSGTRVNTIESLTKLSDYNTSAVSGYMDIWMLGGHMESGIYKDKRTMCLLNYKYVPGVGADISLTFTIYTQVGGQLQ